MLLFLRVYAVAYLVLFLEGIALAPSRAASMSIIQWVDMLIFTPVAVVGLWSAAYRHLTLPKHGWKILLFASVFWRPLAIGNAVLSGNAIAKFQAFLGGLTGQMSSENALAVTLMATAGACLLGSLVIVPPLIALYRNAYGDESLLKLMSPPQLREKAPLPPDQLAEIAARRAAHAAQRSA